MKKQIILFTTLLITGIATTFGQVGIGTNTPEETSILDVTSTEKGFLPPRMTEAQRNAIANPSEGLVVYNTTTQCVEFYDGTCWICSANMPKDGSTSDKASLSCKAIKDKNPSATDGTYWLDIDGCNTAFAPVRAYCDMTTDGGGWTLIGQFNHPATAVAITQRNDFPNRGSDVPTVNETSGTGAFGTWGLSNQAIRQTIAMTEYRVESYNASNGFHFKSTDVSFIKNSTAEKATGKTNLTGKPSYWPTGATLSNFCSTALGHTLTASGYVTFAHSAANCGGHPTWYMVSRVSSSTPIHVNQGITTALGATNGLGRLYVR